MASNLRRSKRTVGKRVNELNRRITRLQKRPAPKRLAQRVIVTDNIAQNTVTNVELAPGAVDAAALDASVSSAISTAQSTADGKNKIFYQTSAPTAVSTGDLWFDTDNGFALSRWDGSSWISFGLGNAAIANLDAGKITAGIISSIEFRAGTPSGGLYPFRVETDGSLRATAATISGAISASTVTGSSVTVGDFSSSTSATGLQITSDGFIQGSGGGVKIKDFSGTTGTILFGNSITSSEINVSLVYSSTIDNDTDIYTTNLIASDDISASKDSATASAPALLLYRSGQSANSYFAGFYRLSNLGEVGKIQYAAGNNSVLYTTTSDKRLKTEIEVAEDALQKINLIPLRHYHWNTDEDRNTFFGTYAQELYEVVPNAVSRGDDSEVFVSKPEADALGVDPSSVWSIDYSQLVPYLVGAIQQLSKKIDDLESRI